LGITCARRNMAAGRCLARPHLGPGAQSNTASRFMSLRPTRRQRTRPLSARTLALGVFYVATPSFAGCLSTADGNSQAEALEVQTQSASASHCAGRSSGGWQAQSANNVSLRVETSGCQLADPVYVTSLGGEGSHWLARGATSLHDTSSRGFRVEVARPQAASIVRSQRWHLNWLALLPSGFTSAATGSPRRLPTTSSGT
jgi:hypothetical protein